MAYTIKRGDTLSQIAKNNNTTVADIQAANPSITNPNKIYAGQMIKLPGQGSTSQGSGSDSGGVVKKVSETASTSKVTPAKPPDYSQYKYDASTDAAYQQALTLLEQAQKNVPTYDGTWDAKAEEIYNNIINREKFSYDLNSDMLYQQYKDQYTLQGKMAMMDTMGQAAAMTGGYGNSYAQTVGQQTYQEYLQQLNDVVLELYGMALDQYNQEGQDLYNQFSMANTLRDNEYGMYRDNVSDWWQDVNYKTDRADTAYNQGYENWYNSYQMGVDAEEREYQRGLDDYNKQQDSYSKLVSLITTTGYAPSAEELKAAGMSSGEAAAYANYYKEQKAAATTKSSGGSSGSKSSGSGTKSTGSTSYNNGSLTSAQVKEVQNALGVEADGMFGPNSQAAAKKLGYNSAEEAYNALVKKGNNSNGSDSGNKGFTGSTYDEAVAYMKSNGVPAANVAGAMTKNEWSTRRNAYKLYGTGGTEVREYDSYEDYIRAYVAYCLDPDA